MGEMVESMTDCAKNDAEGVARDVASVFSDAQRGFASHRRGCRALLKSMERDVDGFRQSFSDAVHRILLIQSQEPSVERIVEFIGLFVAECEANEQSQREIPSQEREDPSFCSFFFRHLLRLSSVQGRSVRFRVLQLLARILKNLGEGVELEESVAVRGNELGTNQAKSKELNVIFG